MTAQKKNATDMVRVKPVFQENRTKVNLAGSWLRTLYKGVPPQHCRNVRASVRHTCAVSILLLMFFWTRNCNCFVYNFAK